MVDFHTGLLLAYKVRRPASFFLLRGNHECASLNRIYGFFDECKRRYSVKLWRVFGDWNCSGTGNVPTPAPTPAPPPSPPWSRG